ncbi:hypothetical protein ACHAWF_000861, partial [Thalassiosira exigua]
MEIKWLLRWMGQLTFLTEDQLAVRFTSTGK